MKIDEKLELMETMFNPKNVAVIGATDNLMKIGGSVMTNLIGCGFKKKIFAVNPNPKYKNKKILGIDVFPCIDNVPEPVDLVGIVVPPHAVVDSIKQAVECDIRTAAIITAGFGEVKSKDRQEENRELIKIADKAGLIFVGPNSLGMYSSKDAESPLHLGMGFMMPHPGNVAVVSQSGTIGALVSNLVRKIKYFVSSGNEASLILEDYLEFFAQDDKIELIALFAEGLRDGARFKRLCSEITPKKPVVFLKGGITKSGARAASSHTASLGGSIDIYRSAFKQTGVIYAENVTEFMYLTKAALFLLPLPDHDPLRVGIVTGGGGFGVILADLAEKHGFDVIDLQKHPDGPKVIEEISKHGRLPFYWSKNNPVDMVATRGASGRKIIEIMLEYGPFDLIFTQTSVGFFSIVELFKPPTEFSKKMVTMMQSVAKERVDKSLKKEIALHQENRLKYPDKKIIYISPTSTLTNPHYQKYDENKIMVFGENPELGCIVIKKLHNYQKYVKKMKNLDQKYLTIPQKM
ncbi:MAG: CoA-binding protein [Candidatus Hodarchaeota archaeon]